MRMAKFSDDVCPTTGKVAYTTQREALDNRIGRKRAYLCAECGCWHLTKQERRKPR